MKNEKVARGRIIDNSVLFKNVPSFLSLTLIAVRLIVGRWLGFV